MNLSRAETARPAAHPAPPIHNSPSRRPRREELAPRQLRNKIILLAVVPLIATIALIALAVRHQAARLAASERALVEDAYMASKRAELRHYTDLALSALKPLYDSGRRDDAVKAEAMRVLAQLDYGSDGYFFLYDLDGVNLMHPRQPELVGRNLWDMRDPAGQPVIRNLIQQARAGGGYVGYLWRKPSTGQVAPKLGYVVALERWNWMLGTGLYLDDVQFTLDQLDRAATNNITTTVGWIAAIAALGLGLIGACGLALNLSEVRAADTKLRLMARQIVRSHENERAHLSRELHDSTSQTLVSIKLLTEAALAQMGRHGLQVPEPLFKAQARIGQALTEVRRMSHRLRPVVLDTLGLPSALKNLVQDFGEHRGLQVSFRVRGELTHLPDDANTVLFRVAQEALNNIDKHAAARTVVVRLVQAGGALRMSIEDDGQGFDVSAMQLDPRRGLGLRNMRERMEAAGGALTIRSGQAGTRLVAQIGTDALRNLAAMRKEPTA